MLDLKFAQESEVLVGGRRKLFVKGKIIVFNFARVPQLLQGWLPLPLASIAVRFKCNADIASD